MIVKCNDLTCTKNKYGICIDDGLEIKFDYEGNVDNSRVNYDTTRAKVYCDYQNNK